MQSQALGELLGAGRPLEFAEQFEQSGATRLRERVVARSRLHDESFAQAEWAKAFGTSFSPLRGCAQVPARCVGRKRAVASGSVPHAVSTRWSPRLAGGIIVSDPSAKAATVRLQLPSEPTA